VVALSVAVFGWLWVDLACMRFVSASAGSGVARVPGGGGRGDLRALPGGAARAGRVTRAGGMPQIVSQGETWEVERDTSVNAGGRSAVSTHSSLVAVIDTGDPAPAGSLIGAVSSLWPFASVVITVEAR
jgi:hypothetical protein